ncbi:hypothetical protein FACS1894142_4550 [Spirochaetia bacterium]|nr:hypothetical protein FACS1894142_4550 [Spirochaetia bacterium]
MNSATKHSVKNSISRAIFFTSQAYHGETVNASTEKDGYTESFTTYPQEKYLSTVYDFSGTLPG